MDQRNDLGRVMADQLAAQLQEGLATLLASGKLGVQRWHPLCLGPSWGQLSLQGHELRVVFWTQQPINFASIRVFAVARCKLQNGGLADWKPFGFRHDAHATTH